MILPYATGIVPLVEQNGSILNHSLGLKNCPPESKLLYSKACSMSFSVLHCTHIPVPCIHYHVVGCNSCAEQMQIRFLLCILSLASQTIGKLSPRTVLFSPNYCSLLKRFYSSKLLLGPSSFVPNTLCSFAGHSSESLMKHPSSP